MYLYVLDTYFGLVCPGSVCVCVCGCVYSTCSVCHAMCGMHPSLLAVDAQCIANGFLCPAVCTSSFPSYRIVGSCLWAFLPWTNSGKGYGPQSWTMECPFLDTIVDFSVQGWNRTRHHCLECHFPWTCLSLARGDLHSLKSAELNFSVWNS